MPAFHDSKEKTSLGCQTSAEAPFFDSMFRHTLEGVQLTVVLQLFDVDLNTFSEQNCAAVF